MASLVRVLPPVRVSSMLPDLVLIHLVRLKIVIIKPERAPNLGDKKTKTERIFRNQNSCAITFIYLIAPYCISMYCRYTILGWVFVFLSTLFTKHLIFLIDLNCPRFIWLLLWKFSIYFFESRMWKWFG